MVLTKSVERLYHKLITGHNSDSNEYLHGAFAPTEEALYKDLPVEGTLPSDVNGAADVSVPCKGAMPPHRRVCAQRTQPHVYARRRLPLV